MKSQTLNNYQTKEHSECVKKNKYFINSEDESTDELSNNIEPYDCDLIEINNKKSSRCWIYRNIDKIFADKCEKRSKDSCVFGKESAMFKCDSNHNKIKNNNKNIDSTSNMFLNYKSFDNLTDNDPHIRPVIIIGNGPSAITLSFILSGHWPYYSHRHPSDAIHQRLSSIFTPQTEVDKSLIECDLSKLSFGLLGRTLNPVSLLFDQLQNPNSDFSDGKPMSSCLEWRFNHKCAIDHLVLGQGLPGGLWYHLRKSKTIFTVSRRLWMQLPGLEIEPALHTSDADESSALNRVSYRQIFDYYQRYVEKFELGANFRNHTQVIRVEWNPDRKYWAIDAVCKVPIRPNCFRTGEDKKRNVCSFSLKNLYNTSTISSSSVNTYRTYRIRYYARKVVLATGASASSSPSHLNIDGEEHKFVIHSLSHFETILQIEKNLSAERLLKNDKKSKILIIVGSGLSAADALSMANGTDFKILHVFRRSVSDRTMIFNQLSNENLYPEYSSIYRRMKQSVKAALCFDCFLSNSTSTYQAYQKCVLDSVEIDSTSGAREASLHFVEQPNKNCSNCNGNILPSKIACDYILVLIGSKPKLDYLQPPELRNSLGRIPEAPVDIRHNPIKIDPSSHECSSFKNLYAMGPLVGDSFVRFVQGGALAIAADLWRKMSSKGT